MKYLTYVGTGATTNPGYVHCSKRGGCYGHATMVNVYQCTVMFTLHDGIVRDYKMDGDGC